MQIVFLLLKGFLSGYKMYRIKFKLPSKNSRPSMSWSQIIIPGTNTGLLTPALLLLNQSPQWPYQSNPLVLTSRWDSMIQCGKYRVLSWAGRVFRPCSATSKLWDPGQLFQFFDYQGIHLRNGYNNPSSHDSCKN